MGNYRRLLAAVRPHAGLLVLAIASMVALAAATGLFSWLVGPMFQYVFRGGELGSTSLPWLPHLDRGELQRALPLLILGIALVRGAAYFGQFYSMGMLGQRVVADLRRALQEKLLALPPAFFARASSGDLLSRFASDVAAVEFAVTYGLASYLRDGMQVLVLLGVSFALDWRLAVFAFVAVPLTVYPIVRFARRLRRIAVRGQEQIGGLYTLLHEALQGVRIVQAFGMERYEADRFRVEQDRFLGTMRRSFFVRAIFTPTLELMAAVGIAATVVLAARAVELGRLQPERVISFLATIVLLYQPLKNLGGTGQGVTQGLAGAQRLYEVLDEPEGLVQHLVQALRAGEALGHALPGAAQVLERLVQEHDGREERDHPLRLEPAQLDRTRGQHHGGGDPDRRHQLERRGEDGADEEAAPHRTEEAILLGAEAVRL